MKDGKDRSMITLLTQDSRISNVELSRKIGLTEGAVRARIERLVKEGTIRRFTIETSEEAGSLAIVMVKAKGNTKAMMKDIERLRLAQHSYEISGEFDGCLVIEGDGLEAIDRKIDLLRKLKNVHDTETFIVLKKW